MPPDQAQDGLRSQTGEIQDQSPKPGTETATSTAPEPGSAKDQTQGSQDTKAGEAKAGPDSKTLLNQDDKKSADAPAGAPEKYEPFKAPEGFTINDEVGALFKELNLSQASAQKLIDYVAPQILESLEAPFKHYQEQRQNWQKEVQDTYGSKLTEVKTTVSRALDGLGNPKLSASFREAMDLTGAGDNPAFINVLYEFAKKVTEGTHVSGSGPSRFGQAAPGAPKTAASAVYPHLPSAG